MESIIGIYVSNFIYKKNSYWIIKINIFSCYSNLIGVQKHFCIIKANDGSKEYSPESKTLLDIPTFLAFFGDLESTKSIVGTYVRGLCDKWNKQYLDKPQVGKFKLIF